MHLRVTLAMALLGGALLLAGCQEEQEDNPDVKVGAVAVPANDGGDAAASGSSQTGVVESLDERLGITPEQNEMVRAAVLKAASDLGWTLDEEYNVLRGEELPEAGVSLTMVLDKTKQLVHDTQRGFDEATVGKLAQSVVRDQIPPPPGVEVERTARESDKFRKDQSQNAQQQKSPAKPPLDKSKLTLAKQIIGDWKSTEEIHSRFTAKHDDKYYEFVNISNDGKVIFKVYRAGELISDRRFDYTFSEKSGELKLKDASGAVVNSLVAYHQGKDETHLYLEYQSGTITVYQQVGRTGVPLTPEQEASLNESRE